MKKFYIDTCIWIDLLEDRKGFNSEPLGAYASKFFLKVFLLKMKIVFSDVVQKELFNHYSEEQIQGLLNPFINDLIIVKSSKEQKDLAHKISIRENIPFNDALHAVLAKASNSIFITRDKHFDKIISYFSPEKAFL
jgi:predicted nucleic acid-binding protein